MLSSSHDDSVSVMEMAKRSISLLRHLEKNIHSGDLITRTGNDFTSYSLKGLNQRNQTYSHCGIASVEHDSVFVYHALGGEWNPDAMIRRDPLLDFGDPFNNSRIGIFRFNIGSIGQEKLVMTARDFYKRKLSFDMDFDLATDDKMYCAEFVYKSFNKALPDSIKFNLSHIGKFKFIGVDDLFLHPLSVCEGAFIYK